MRRGLLWLERQLTIRRMLVIGLLMLLAHDLPQWWNDANWQGDANPFCGRQQFPAATGPGGSSVFAYRIVCETIAKPSMTYVYLHQISRGDRPVNLILRYIGNPPRVEWIDPPRDRDLVDAQPGKLAMTDGSAAHRVSRILRSRRLLSGSTALPSVTPSPGPPARDAPA